VPWSPLLELSATEQAGLIARRDISSEELVRLYLDRIAEVQPRLHAMVEVWPDEAIAAARRRDRAGRRGGKLPAFYGVPTAIKDLYPVRGHVTHFGSRAVAIPSPIDSVTTRSFRRGGFVLLGTTATSELGVMPVTEPDTHAPTRNPWDLRRSAGGSSGGAGAAVASAMLPIAHASDGAGSIRIPCALNHLFGFKPSRGRVANAFGFDDRHLLYTCGPAARSVGDAAALLDVLAGLDVGRPHWLAPPTEPFAATFDRDPGRLRIGLMLDNPVTRPDPAIVAQVHEVAATLTSLGHEVVERTAPGITLDEFLPIYQLMVAGAPVMLPRRLQPVTTWLRDAGRRLDPAEVLAVQHRLTVQLARVIEGVDLLLTPTVAVQTPEVGRWRNVPPEVAFREAAELGGFTAAANITGSPAATIPAGLLEGRWPVGAQLVARPGEDALVLQVARQLEMVRPWAGRWAPGAGRPEPAP
jgi:amidase